MNTDTAAPDTTPQDPQSWFERLSSRIGFIEKAIVTAASQAEQTAAAILERLEALAERAAPEVLDVAETAARAIPGAAPAIRAVEKVVAKVADAVKACTCAHPNAHGPKGCTAPKCACAATTNS